MTTTGPRALLLEIERMERRRARLLKRVEDMDRAIASAKRRLIEAVGVPLSDVGPTTVATSA